MYHPITVDHLSPTQIRNLLSGRGVRVKLGNAHKLHVSEQQYKKMHSAHRKGKGMTLQFDPFQMHQHGGSLKSFGKMLKQGAQHIGHALKPMAREAFLGAVPGMVEGLSAMTGQPELMALTPMAQNFAGQAFDYGAHKVGVGRKRHVGRPKRGGAINFRGMLKKGFEMAKPHIKHHAQQALAHYAPQAIEHVGNLTGQHDLANQFGSMAHEHANNLIAGMGRHRRVGRPVKRHGGALMPAGY